MKKIFIVLLLLLAGCSQVDQERIVNETLESIKPCILDLAFTQDVQAAEDCMTEKVGAVARDEIELALGDYLADAKPEVLELLGNIFGVKSPYSIAHEIIKLALGYLETPKGTL
jgi:hypothetical protein